MVNVQRWSVLSDKIASIYKHKHQGLRKDGGEVQGFAVLCLSTLCVCVRVCLPGFLSAKGPEAECVIKVVVVVVEQGRGEGRGGRNTALVRLRFL